MLLVDDLAAGGTKNLRHTPRGLVTLIYVKKVMKLLAFIFEQPSYLISLVSLDPLGFHLRTK